MHLIQYAASLLAQSLLNEMFTYSLNLHKFGKYINENFITQLNKTILIFVHQWNLNEKDENLYR